MITMQKMNEIANAIIELKKAITDEQALLVKNLYPTWEDLVNQNKTVESGYRFIYNNKLYKTLQSTYTFMSHWVPGSGTESLFTVINETNAGTLEDPIPYEGNMELFNGKYYIQNGIIYKCTRDNGQPLYHALSDLVGLYVTVVS